MAAECQHRRVRQRCGQRMCVQPQAQLLGSAAVGFSEQHELAHLHVGWGPERGLASPAGTHLAGQSGKRLTIMILPGCTTCVELESESAQRTYVQLYGGSCFQDPVVA